MKSTEFIKQKIDEIVVKFPYIRCRYANDIEAETHVIEISPKNIYQSEKFTDLENELVLDFIRQYPLESLVFIPEDDLIKIDCVDYLKTGIKSR